MSFSVIVRPAAEADLAEAQSWYERKRTGLGDKLVACVDETLEKLTRWPDLGSLVHKQMRRAPVRRFPYGVFYLIVGEQIIVLGIIHGRRAPRQWKKRLE